MTLQQLRGLCEVVNTGYSVSRAAEALNTSQPAVSKLMRQLESHLGVAVFVRFKGRVVGLTSIGEEVLEIARRVLRDTGGLSDLIAERTRSGSGLLRIGTTHFHARHTLLDVLLRFSKSYPGVDVYLLEGHPEEIVNWVADGRVHVGITTLPPELPETVQSIPAYSIDRYVITPLEHPLIDEPVVSIEALARYPIIAFDAVYQSGAILDRLFSERGLQPRIPIRTSNPTVIKAYVAAGIGISVMGSLAIDTDDRSRLALIDARHLFPSTHVHVCLRRGDLVRGYTYELIADIAPQWAPPPAAKLAVGL